MRPAKEKRTLIGNHATHREQLDAPSTCSGAYDAGRLPSLGRRPGTGDKRVAKRLGAAMAPWAWMALVLGAVLAMSATALRAEAAGTPNVVLIISDDQAWTDFGFMGHEVIRTPHLDRLAAEGAVFTRGYVPSSLCRPSLATIITGLFPHQHGITGNDPPRGTDRRLMLRHMSAEDPLPRLLARQGYISLQTGKWWEGHHALGGFTHGMTHGDVRRGGRHGDEGLAIGRKGMQPIFDFIRQHAGRPFFVWYAPFLPHNPHNPPAEILARYSVPGRPPKLARYYAMCEWFDQTCGELLDFLDREKLRDNTLVAFVVDNGWIQQTGPRRTTSGWYAPKSKRSPYDGGLRTPILLRWPGHIEPKRYDVPVSSVDLAPTILAACGADVPQRLPGVNLLDYCDGQPPRREAIFGEIFSHDAVDIDRPAANLQYRWCVEGEWKLILPQAGGVAAAELYNVVADPHETKNVAGEHPEIVARLHKRIEQWWTPNPENVVHGG